MHSQLTTHCQRVWRVAYELVSVSCPAVLFYLALATTSTFPAHSCRRPHKALAIAAEETRVSKAAHCADGDGVGSARGSPVEVAIIFGIRTPTGGCITACVTTAARG